MTRSLPCCLQPGICLYHKNYCTGWNLSTCGDKWPTCDLQGEDASLGQGVSDHVATREAVCLTILVKYGFGLVKLPTKLIVLLRKQWNLGLYIRNFFLWWTCRKQSQRLLKKIVFKCHVGRHSRRSGLFSGSRNRCGIDLQHKWRK